MNTSLLTDCLNKFKKRELGIPMVLPSIAGSIFQIAEWALQGTPIEGRQVWFVVGNAKEIRNQFPSHIRPRIQPLEPFAISSMFERGPYDSLLIPKHGFSYSDPNLTLSEFWRNRGSYEMCDEFTSEEFTLWFWKSKFPPLKLFGIDHHHAVLWDAMQILRPLGIQVDFHWLSDGRPPINEAIPASHLPWKSSLDIYRPPPETPLSDEMKQYIQQYDGIITSHSMVTCFRLKEVGLPLFHINSTRFGNDWIQVPSKHALLVDSIRELLRQKRLHIIHNNQGDLEYLHQYIPSVDPSQELVIPSLCENALRLRMSPPQKPKLLLWDTRQILLKQDQSPFMKELYYRLLQTFPESIQSQAILMAQTKQYLPEGYLDDYTAVIHIPYNISTMSMFQQVRANIPIWVPSKSLLAKLWTDPKEPNELSWTVFAAGSEANASTMDKCRDPEVVKRWIDNADFYNPEILPLCFQFDSIEDLLEKALTLDYASAIQKAEEGQQKRREHIIFSWEQVIRKGLNK